MRGCFFLPLIERLVNIGIEVEVLTPLWGERCASLSMQSGFHGERVWRFAWPGKRLAGLSLIDPRSLFSLFRFLNRWRWALGELRCQQGVWDATLAAWGVPAGLLLRTRALCELPSAIWWLGTDFNRFDKPWFKPLIKLVASGGYENWSNSHRIVDGLWRRAGVLAHFVPLLSLPKTELSTIAHKNLLPRVLSIGRLDTVKGFDFGLRAALELMRRGVKFEYRLVGSGPQYKELAALIGTQKNIHLLGFLDRNALKHEMESADIVFIPSRQEGMPLVFFEALAAGKPLVVTDVGDIGRCLVGTQLGLVSMPGDVVGMADNLERALAGEIYFDASKAKELLMEYSLDHAVEAVRILISKRKCI
jgi:glycosyltransferase involved in cell wall biosynthesis